MGGLPQLAIGSDFTPIREALAAYRQAGLDFDKAWQHALRVARRDDRPTLRDTEAAWRKGYERQTFYSAPAF